ncbi:MAG: DUF3524 domain-containing protein [Desulfuromonas sp.]|uniref:tRNA-queuosine alpha-mannosyltransferase domain-containing protein n=1 Tax=Desulfuromonas sp. TaxID=892 RepID=UPI000CAACE49|nr:DUF3524 domain-containing protein [Desulfuromonas sp.]PLX81767.1 MAG: DUF3524 domain-containing protein [Desulfuromonas sp.]
MKITLLEPFYAGSHAVWVDEFVRCSRHDIEVLKLGGRHWKWRMHGAAVTLARRYLAGTFEPDLLLATDMLDLTVFLALTRQKTARLPVAIYFHENQLTYPWSPDDRDPAQQRDAHYGFINYASALAADAVLFNSRYHLESFLGELPRFLRSFPDHNELNTLPAIAEKCSVLPVGMDLKRLDAFRPPSRPEHDRSPLILWNHRWEYDKNPEEFFEALYRLQDEGLCFDVAILGESFGGSSPHFAEARQRLGKRVVHFGYAEDFADYAAWLWRADLLPVHSLHDFFGVSVVQAMHCNCVPLLPNRLAYPEHVPEDERERFFYTDFEDLVRRMRNLLKNPDPGPGPEPHSFVARYDWEHMAPRYDALLEELVLEQKR